MKFRSSKAKGIQGKVTDFNNRPLRGAKIILEGADLGAPKNNLNKYVVEQTFTNKKGYFWLERAKRECSIFVDLGGYLPKRISGKVPEGGFKKIDILLEVAPTEIVAHRGGSAYAPENTLAAFKKAIQMGFRTLELDVQLTRDKEVVVVHDEIVDRTTNSSGLVRSYKLRELKKLDAGSWFDGSFEGEEIPSLQEVIGLTKGKANLLIELKNEFFSYPGLEARVVELLKKNDLLQDTIVTSFNEESIFRMGMRFPRIKLGLLIRNLPRDLGILKYLTYLHAILPDVDRVNKSFVDQAHLRGLRVYGWTANKLAGIRRLIRLEVDGIISDYPLRVIGALEQG
jgi:glycerophosphoryl diester phosphodiesterase